MIGEHALDLQASALLLTVVEQQGGDLRAAFAVLCACVSPADIEGEAYQAALIRAVGALYARPVARLLRSVPDGITPSSNDA